MIMHILEMWMQGFYVAASGTNLIYLFVGTFSGLVIGALPGLGANFALSIALPLTFWVEPASAIILMCSLHASATFGGSISAILINAPGTVGSVAACWDGHPLSQQGKAKLALGVSALGSVAGGFIGWVMLVATTPILIFLALKMGPAEYFMVAMLALCLLSLAAGGETIKGLIMGGLGLMLAFVGMDPTTGAARYTMGSLYLEDGIPLVPVAVGLFALSQAIIIAEKGGTVMQVAKMSGSAWEGVSLALRKPITILRCSIIGVLMGIVPALGVSTANIVAYLVEKRAAKDPESFGKGNPIGVLAPESANNACVVGELVPTFTLGIPGASPAALLLAALMLHGIQPGPDYFSKGALPYAVFVGVLLAQFAFFFLGLGFAGFFAKVCLIPNALLVSLVTVLCFMGAYAWRNTLIDVFLTIFFGIFGYILIKAKWPHACVILGFVLGKLIEANFHRALLIAHGSYATFFKRPGSLSMIIVMVALLSWPYLSALFLRRGTKNR